MLESGIEAAFGRKLCEFAQAELNHLGYDAAYLKIQGARGWPDRLIIWGHFDGPAHYIWVEWKRPGEKPRPFQLHIHKILRAMGAEVRVYDDWRAALEEITQEIRTEVRANPRNAADL